MGIGAGIFIILLAVGFFFQSVIQSHLALNVVESLKNNARSKVKIFASVQKQMEEDLTGMRAHKSIEDYFTARIFGDYDGMTEAVSSLEPFFLKINNDKPMLQLNTGKRVEKYDRFDETAILKKIVTTQVV